MDAPEFWSEVRKRRNHFGFAFLGWLPFGVVCGGLAYAMRLPGIVSGPLILSLWYLLWIGLARRLKALRCPRCDSPAIAHPYFFMKDARCQCCGLRPGEELIQAPQQQRP